MWERTKTTKTIVIDGTQYTLSQIMASLDFTINDTTIPATTLGGWICDDTTLDEHAWCDAQCYIINSKISGSLLIEKTTILDSTLQTFNGHLKNASIFYSQLTSDTLTLIGEMTLTALRTMSTVFSIHATGKLMDCAFHGNVSIAGDFQMITSEWRGKMLQLTDVTRWQHVHMNVQEAMFVDTTCKQYNAHAQKTTIIQSTLIQAEIHGQQYHIEEADWHNVDISIAYLSFTKSELDDLLIFSPLGHLKIEAPVIIGENLNVHYEKIDAVFKEDTPFYLAKGLLY